MTIFTGVLCSVHPFYCCTPWLNMNRIRTSQLPQTCHYGPMSLECLEWCWLSGIFNEISEETSMNCSSVIVGVRAITLASNEFIIQSNIFTPFPVFVFTRIFAIYLLVVFTHMTIHEWQLHPPSDPSWHERWSSGVFRLHLMCDTGSNWSGERIHPCYGSNIDVNTLHNLLLGASCYV